MSTATEGRTCRIHLLNGESVDVVLNKNHSVRELFAFANRQCGLPEASWKWFSLAFINHKNEIVWLPANERITQISFPREAIVGELNLFQYLRFFPRSCSSVPDALMLIHIFYDVRMQFLKGYLLLDYADFVACCSALILLCNSGLLLDAEEVAEVFNEQIRPPVQLLRRFDAPLDEIHGRVSETIKRLQPLTQGQLIIEFLKHAECSLTIGSAFYGVYDASSGHPLVLAINSRCLVLFEPSNVYQPKKIFRFQHVDSIQWKEKAFSVHLRQRSSLNAMSEQHENGLQTLPNRSCSKTTLLCETAANSKVIYGNACAQHKFFCEQQILNKPNEKPEHATQRLAEQLEALLASSNRFSSISTSSLDSYASSNRNSRSSMPCAANMAAEGGGTSISSSSLHFPTKFADEAPEQARSEYSRLKSKLSSIEEELVAKLTELKAICVAEAEITGVMPKEIYRTLLPGEQLPRFTKRVGTAFRLDAKLIENAGATDRMDQLQAEIQVHRQIVQAAERLANDRTANKSVRRKRRKDFHAAASRLRGLERGLYQMRFSGSKPDISGGFDAGALSRLTRSNRPGSGFSLNSLRNWPNFLNGRSAPKSCPTTPRGSVPDLSASTEQLQHSINEQQRSNPTDSLDNRGRRPLDMQWHTPSTSSSALPPSVPTRRPTVSSLNSTDSAPAAVTRGVLPSSSASELPMYTNIGYRSCVPYRSAYRQSNFPTMQASAKGRWTERPSPLQEQSAIQRSKSVTSGTPSKESRPSASTQFSIQKSDFSAFVAHPRRVVPANSSDSSLRSSSSTGGTSLSAFRSPTATAEQLDAIVRHMNEKADELRKTHSSVFTAHRSPSNGVVMRPGVDAAREHAMPNGIPLSASDYSTASLDRRLLRRKAEDEKIERETQARDSVSSGISSASSSISPTSMSRTTTFPVEFNFTSRTPTTKRPSSDRLCLSISSSRVQPLAASHLPHRKHQPIDARMENLLASIHTRGPVQLAPTSLHSNDKPKRSAASKNATMV